MFSLLFLFGNSILKKREETGFEVGGNYVPGQSGFVAGKWTLMHRYETVILAGKGYVKVRWETE